MAELHLLQAMADSIMPRVQWLHEFSSELSDSGNLFCGKLGWVTTCEYLVSVYSVSYFWILSSEVPGSTL